jgi:HD-GYP domain-containing protein (c-di-GMP phosphodiesterase class II)
MLNPGPRLLRWFMGEAAPVRAPDCGREQLETNIHAAQLLGHAVALRDHGTVTHNMRVAWMTSRLGEALSLDRATMQAVMKGAFLHDVGKIGISDAILLKPGPLSVEERSVMNGHPELGAELIQDIAWFSDARPIVLHHHERYDGTGYPQALRGEAIPLAARLFAVVDVFDALISDRPYKPALSCDLAVAFMAANAVSHFDPAILEVFLPLAPKLHATMGDQEVATLKPLLESQRRKHFGV